MKVKISKLYFYLIGFGALIWFLIRVIPKPSRATYPCQRAAFPIASAFVIHVAGLFTSSFAFLKFRKHQKEGNSLAAAIFFFITAISSLSILQSDRPNIYASYKSILENSNEPIGTGKGIFPGRVVWVRDSTAVDQHLTNQSGDYWWMDDNVDQTVVNSMVSNALQSLTGEQVNSEAWDAIFKYYNHTHGKGNIGYTSGERIVIKLNLNNGPSGSQYTRIDNRPVDTSPQIVYAVLDQLINSAGVPQSSISVGDPGRTIDDIFWNKLYSVFPNVKYWGEGNGRTPIEPSASKAFFTSDGKIKHYMPACYIEAAYMINIPVFKQHHRAGISLAAKNHIGTFVPFTPWVVRDSLHHSMPSSAGNGIVDNGDYHLYRIFVDFIGHKDLGAKTILFLVDGLWSSTNYNGEPWKWRTSPFNNSYPASIFASIDAVAIESVGFDFLSNEFYVGNPSGEAFSCYSGVDDYLHQAADSVNWPAGIVYDPENDGTYLPRSMGVHEHWNNANDMQYLRNLGGNEGIELIKVSPITEVNEITSHQPTGYLLGYNYPNPFNPSTRINFSLPVDSKVTLKVFDVIGQEVATLINSDLAKGIHKVNFNSSSLNSGVYFYKMKASGIDGTNFTSVKKMILIE